MSTKKRNPKYHYEKSTNRNPKEARDFSEEQGLATWSEVTTEWNRRSGANLTRSFVMKIARAAHQKLRRGLQGIEF